LCRVDFPIKLAIFFKRRVDWGVSPKKITGASKKTCSPISYFCASWYVIRLLRLGWTDWRAGNTHAPAMDRWFDGAVSDPAITGAASIGFLRSIEHHESSDQSQHCYQERKHSEFSEKLHPISPPFFRL
jgi:hypothetical protein